MRLAIANYCPRAGLRLIKTRSGICHHGAAPRSFPNSFAGLRFNCDDETLPAAAVGFWSLDEFRIVLKIRQDYFVVTQDRRGSRTVLADERSEVPLPSGLPLMVESSQKI